MAVLGIKVESGHWRQAWIWTVKFLLVCQAARLKDVDSGWQFVEETVWKHVVGEAKERITQHSATREQEKPALSLLEYWKRDTECDTNFGRCYQMLRLFNCGFKEHCPTCTHSFIHYRPWQLTFSPLYDFLQTVGPVGLVMGPMGLMSIVGLVSPECLGVLRRSGGKSSNSMQLTQHIRCRRVPTSQGIPVFLQA